MQYGDRNGFPTPIQPPRDCPAGTPPPPGGQSQNFWTVAFFLDSLCRVTTCAHGSKGVQPKRSRPDPRIGENAGENKVHLLDRYLAQMDWPPRGDNSALGATEIHRFAAIVENEAGRIPSIAAPRLSLQLFYRRIPCGSRERELRFRFRLCQQRQYVRRGCSGGPWAIPRDGRFGGK